MAMILACRRILLFFSFLSGSQTVVLALPHHEPGPFLRTRQLHFVRQTPGLVPHVTHDLRWENIAASLAQGALLLDCVRVRGARLGTVVDVGKVI